MRDVMKLDDPRLRRLALVVAFVIFIGGIGLSLHDRPDSFKNIEIRPILMITLVITPLMIVLNIFEFMMMARLVEQRPTMLRASEITIFGTLANMLPLPGGMLVRIAALRTESTTTIKVTLATLFVFLIWIGVGFLWAGIWFARLRDPFIGVLVGLFGSSVLASTFWGTVRFSRGRILPGAALIILRVGSVALESARILAAVVALGEPANFAQASVLSVASVVGASLSLVPAGLGIREAAAAALAPAVGLGAAVVFLAASVTRIIGLIVNALVAGLLVITPRQAMSSGSVDTAP